MATAKTCSNATVRSFLSRHRPRFSGSPVPGSITRPSCHPPKRFLSVAGSMRSIPAGPFSEVAGLRPPLGEKDFVRVATGSGRPCGRWGSRASIRGPISASGHWNTRSTRTCFGTSPPSIRIISGESTSPTSACLAGGCTLSPLSTGTPGMSCPGRSIRPLRCPLFSMRWIGLFRPLYPLFSTVTREAISPATAIWNAFFPETSRSAWTERDAPSTTSSRNGSGEVSSMRKFISMNTTVLDMPERESGIGSHSTIRKDRTNPWITRHLGKFSLQGTHQDLLQAKSEGTRSKTRDSVSIYVLKSNLKTVLTKPPTSYWARCAQRIQRRSLRARRHPRWNAIALDPPPERANPIIRLALQVQIATFLSK